MCMSHAIVLCEAADVCECVNTSCLVLCFGGSVTKKGHPATKNRKLQHEEKLWGAYSWQKIGL